jgi:transposase-like protein
MRQSITERVGREGIEEFGRQAVDELIRRELKGRMQGAALMLVSELFEQEVRKLCGAPWSSKEPAEPRRGGWERGRIYLEGQAVGVKRPRVRQGGQEVGLRSYAALQSYDLLAEQVQRKMLRGVSTRDYAELLEEWEGGLGLPRSQVSAAFVRASQKSLDQLNGRDLSKQEFVVMFLDAQQFAGSWVVVAMGLERNGSKRILGLQEGHTENAAVVGTLLDNLVERGLVLSERFLAVIDGSKALKAALLRRWEGRVVIQRCQVHKKRNVLEQLPKQWHAEVKRRLNAAYGMKDADEAAKSLEQVVRWLEGISEPAARSLQEGLEETLTVIRLQVPEVLRRTLATTNPIESVLDSVRQRTRRVKRWRGGNSRMLTRWTAAALLMVERRLHKVKGHALMGVLVDALARHNMDTQRKIG